MSKGISRKTGKNPFWGKKHSLKSKKKMSKALKKNPTKYWLGKKRSKKTNKKISKTLKKNPVRYWLGKKLSKEHKKKNGNGHRGNKCHFYIDGRTNNPEWRKWLLNKRARLKGYQKAQGNSHTFGEWQNLKAQYNYTCPCCRKSEPKINLTHDHIIPLSKGGSDNIENIQPLCKSCNSRKYTKIIKF